MDKLEKSRQLLSTAILNNFIGRITGAGLKRIVGSNPENVLLVGKLMSTNDSDEHSNNTSKTFIESIGSDFYISEDRIEDAEITVLPQGDFYYRVIPSLAEQRETLLKEINESRTGKEYSSFDEVIKDYKSGDEKLKKAGAKLVPVYKKISIDCEAAKVVFRPIDLLDDGKECGFVSETHALNTGLYDYLQDMQRKVNSDSEVMKKHPV